MYGNIPNLLDIVWHIDILISSSKDLLVIDLYKEISE